MMIYAKYVSKKSNITPDTVDNKKTMLLLVFYWVGLNSKMIQAYIVSEGSQNETLLSAMKNNSVFFVKTKQNNM